MKAGADVVMLLDAWIRDVMCCLPGVRPPTGPATGLVLGGGMKKFLSQVSSHQPIVAIVAIVTIA